MSKVRDAETQFFNKINPAVKFSVTRYVLAIGIFVAVVAFGLVSTGSLGIDLLPKIVVPVVTVSTSYPGASAGVMDQQVTQVVENAVSQVSGITDIISLSQIGYSRVIILFDLNVDKNSVMNQVASQIQAKTKVFPTGINPPVVGTFDPSSVPVLQFGVSGGGASLGDVGDYITNTLQPALERVAGVAAVTTDGNPTRQFNVLLNPDRLAYYDISPQDVINAITNSAVEEPIGNITTRGNSLTFSTQNVPSNLGEIRKIPVDAVRGISVSDVGVVRDAQVETDDARVNGVPVVLVSIQQTTDSNTIAVVDGVKKLLAGTTLPAGYTITYSNDTTGPIRASIQSTFHELFMTLLVVALIVLLFLGKPNTAFSVILAIPIAISASPILYKLMGFSFNLVSLLALVIAIGVVVDDSIVVAENVERYRAMGFNLKDSVLKGASEVFSAVVAASLSLLSVLLPVSFIGGFIGMYIQQFSLGLAAAVAFSLLEALLFLTVRLAYTPEGREMDWRDFGHDFLRLPEAIRWGFRVWKKGFGIVFGVLIALGLLITKHAVFVPALLAYPVALGLANYLITIALGFIEALTHMLHGWTEYVVEKVRDGYVNTLGRLLKRSAWILIISASFLVVSAVLVLPHIPFNFVPNSDSGSLSIETRFPSGTPINVANDVMGKFEAWLFARPEVATVQTIVTHESQIIVTLGDIHKRKNAYVLAQEYRAALLKILINTGHPSARLQVGVGGGFQGQGSALMLNVVGADINALVGRDPAILDAVQHNPYVSDVTSALSDTTLENDFVPDPAKLKGTGISAQTIATDLMAYTTGVQASNVITGGLSYPIWVQLDPTYLSGGQSLLSLPVYSNTLNANLQAGQLGNFVINEVPVARNRFDRLYTDMLTINLKPNAPPQLAVMNQISADLTKRGLLGDGVELQTGGRFSQAALAAQLMTTGTITFLLAIFLAYLVMAAQFNSWRYPVYLLLPVPIALVGALLFIFFRGGGLDIFGILGLFMLIGLSAKNAILYLDFVVERLGKMPFTEALIEAARLRFRPIVMTTLTVLVISFPLVFSTGQGSEYGQRMGMVMFGGILFSALLTFFVVPAAFYQFERKRQVAVEGEASGSELEGGSPELSAAGPESGPRDGAPTRGGSSAGDGRSPADPQREPGTDEYDGL
ncbi:MAG: efflux RND transporter permease subunit [Treponema sp.]|nr:efflux RND transporter permease subunit [Treponema sp.]